MATLFIIQNETHLDNFVELSSLESGDQFLLIDEFCGFKIPEQKINKINVTYISIDKENCGFYRVNGVRRFVYAIKTRLKKKYKTLNTPNKILIGVDGAIQKQVIHYFKSIDRNIKVEMWSDGLLEVVNKGLLLRIIVKLEPFLCKLKIDSYLPCVTATSSLIDELFVMSESCKKSVMANGFRGGNISVKDFPRVKSLKNIKRKDNTSRLLLIVSAFSWHGRSDIEQWEIELIDKFIAWYEIEPRDFILSIRPHPRSSQELVDKIERSGYKSQYNECNEDIVHADLLVSYASTCLFDGYSIGKKVYTYDNEAPIINRGAFVESLPKLNSLNEIITEIARLTSFNDLE